MKNRRVLPALCAALLLCFGLSACSPRGSETRERPIAVQMFTLGRIASLEERFEAVRAAGIRSVEISTLDIDANNLSGEEMRALLDKHGLRVVSMLVGINRLREDFSGLVALNKKLGNRVLVLAWLVKGERPETSTDWVALGKEIGQFAERLKAKGMTLAYHNHDFEMAVFDGKTALEFLFEGAGPELKAEIDVAWAARGGQDPAEILERLSGRVFAIHAKDNWPEGQGEAERGFTDVGSGVLDWAGLLSAAKQAGVQWYIIEHDHPIDPAKSIKVSAEYLRKRLP